MPVGSGWRASTSSRAGSATVAVAADRSAITQTKDPVGGLPAGPHSDLLVSSTLLSSDNLRRDGLGEVASCGSLRTKARQRGCVAAVLYTINFQAPGFYERHG